MTIEMTTTGFAPIPADLAEMLTNAVANLHDGDTDAHAIARRLVPQIMKRPDLLEACVTKALVEWLNERRRHSTQSVLAAPPSSPRMQAMKAQVYNPVGGRSNAAVAGAAMVRDYLRDVFVRGVPLGAMTKAGLIDAAALLVAQARGELRNAGFYRAVADRMPAEHVRVRDVLSNDDLAQLHETAAPLGAF